VRVHERIGELAPFAFQIGPVLEIEPVALLLLGIGGAELDPEVGDRVDQEQGRVAFCLLDGGEEIRKGAGLAV